MNRFKFILFSFLIFPFIFSCNNLSETKEKVQTEAQKIESELYSQIMGAHDSAMNKLDEIMEMKMVLNEELERMGNGLDAVHEERKKAIREIINELEGADDGMMEWMRNYARKPADSLGHIEIMERLKDSYTRVGVVKVNIDSAIFKAKQLLE
ncbi:MAG: hypothetical protein OEW75_03080 [Cyclobacteriaceae bacterium]|nr:hypothetical protein [Cyclobacteriaceae bacterium]